MSDNTLAQTSLQAWDANAAVWNESVGLDGNIYWHALQEPCIARLLADRLAAHTTAGTPCRALELSTGNGIGARWLAARGADVTATDGSVGMIEGARSRGDAGGRITFGTLDVTDEAGFLPFVAQADAVRTVSYCSSSFRCAL